ncbi:MAG: TrkA family potassium uptake protein [Acidimicrobiales bacterium]|nr:TrkA family potassium uptake protein [Acidimicrobiales bacterium]MCB1005173.1 TrkA family potassium uptake protein [Acidimicrobiales bacterium]
MARRKRRETILVVGLGRFGSAVALELESLDHEVLVIDPSEQLVQRYASQVTHAVEGDATDPDTLLSLGVDELRHAVVAIGDDMEASILATAAIADLGVENVWAKAATASHASILERVGADHVVFAERDMGRRVAHRVTGQIIDYIQIDDDFALVETGPPSDELGRTLGEAQLRQRYDVTVVSIKPAGGHFTYATPETVLAPEAILLVAGTNAAVERFAAIT